MAAYYNEHDPYAAQWLRNLIQAGHIAPGDVDERSIVDVRADDIKSYKQCHFFAGIGVWSHALRGAGWTDDRAVWTGSCPCQPFSTAGAHGGFNDERHLWPEFFRLIQEIEPLTIIGEQVASKDGYVWLDLVQSDLENCDYTFGAVVTPASGFGAPHQRHRMYWVADSTGSGWFGSGKGTPFQAGWEQGPEPTRELEGRPEGCTLPGNELSPTVEPRNFWSFPEWLSCIDGRSRPVEPGTFPLAHGAASRVGRLRAYGNAICAPQAEAFVTSYMELIR